MKYKILILSTILLLFISSCEDIESDFEPINIKAFYYPDGKKLPVQCDTFYLSITQMRYQSIDSTAYLNIPYLNKVVEEYTFLPTYTGRYVISASYQGKKDVLDIYYNGGGFSLSMIIQ